jgi:hypothetical protein
MPIFYERDDQNRRIVATSIGTVTFDQTIEVIDRQVAERAWSYSVLHDARASASVPTRDEVRRLMLHLGKLTTKNGPRGPVAFVVSDPTLSKIGQWYASLGDLTALNVRVFTSIEEADAWLDAGA